MSTRESQKWCTNNANN